MILGLTEKVVIEINPTTNEYSMDINCVNLDRLEAVLEDILAMIKDGSIQDEEGIENLTDLPT